MYGDSVPYPKLEMWLVLLLKFFRLKIVVFISCCLSLIESICLAVVRSLRQSLVGPKSFIDISFATVDRMEEQWIIICLWIHSIDLL